MRESVIYQEIFAEGEQRGREQGREQGRLAEGQSLILRLLTHRVGELPQEMGRHVREAFSKSSFVGFSGDCLKGNGKAERGFGSLVYNTIIAHILKAKAIAAKFCIIAVVQKAGGRRKEKFFLPLFPLSDKYYLILHDYLHFN